ncbi:MAG: beta-propeller fold lactonase family protein [Verrucomicrobiota bacterium]|nr:beta-propeller fold lactonase family protein [Verrucomicrobiota bacterium]
MGFLISNLCSDAWNGENSRVTRLLPAPKRSLPNEWLRIVLAAVFLSGASVRAAESGYEIYVSNERSGDVSVIDGATDEVTATFAVGKRPRGIHCAPDGKHVYVALSGSPRMAPGVDHERAPADKSADGIGVIDAATKQLTTKLSAGSDPEQFALTKDGKSAVIANEDQATASIVDLANGKLTGDVKVADEPEGVAVNPANGQVYVTCEENGEVYVIEPEHAFSPAHFKVGARPRSAAFLPDGSRAYVPSEAEASISVVDTAANKVIAQIKAEGMPMGAVVSPDGKELYVTNGRGNSVLVIDTKANAVVTKIEVGERVWGLALSPDGSKLYTANGASNDV